MTDDDVKTRGQKEKLEEVTTPSADQKEGEKEGETEANLPKIPRDGTMVVTAKVCVYLSSYVLTYSLPIQYYVHVEVGRISLVQHM